MWRLESSQTPSAELLQKARAAFKELIDRPDLGFKDSSHIKQAVDSCGKHKAAIQKHKSLVVIGVGGSSLGTKALARALFPQKRYSQITFLDNVDARSIEQLIDSIDDPKEVGWILCSKSGSTIEVLSLYEYCYQALNRRHSFQISDNTWIVTESKKSPLYDFACERNIPLLEIPKSVGGRFSAFTAIGLLPLQKLDFQGLEAKKGFDRALDDEEAVCQMAATLYPCVSEDIGNLYSFQYCDRLGQWSFWLQQLWSESLSKKRDRQGGQAPKVSTFVPCRGVSDQHSVLQQIIEGHEPKLVCFHRVLDSENSRSIIEQTLFPESLVAGKSIGQLMGVELEATVQAVQNSGSATLTLTTDNLSEASMGYIMGLWMLVVGVLGEMIDINAFDQPGVESGKVIARRVLKPSD